METLNNKKILNGVLVNGKGYGFVRLTEEYRKFSRPVGANLEIKPWPLKEFNNLAPIIFYHISMLSGFQYCRHRFAGFHF